MILSFRLSRLGKLCHKLLLFVVLLLAISNGVLARLSLQEQINIYEEEYLQGFTLIEIGKGVQAEVIFRDLISCLNELPERKELLFLKARVGLAFSLERQRDFEPAMEMLLPLLEEAKVREAYAVEAQILIRLALIHEQTNFASICADYLRKAEQLIERHDLAEEWPQLAVRWSSYHRIYDSPDSSLHYAALAAELGEKFAQPIHAGVGYMLQGVMTSDINASMAAFEQASQHFAIAGDFYGSASILINLTGISLGQKDYTKALAYNSEGLSFLNQATPSDTRELSFRAELLRLRASIYKEKQLMDSSFYYQQLASATALKVNEKYTEGKILEIEKRYETEKKNAQIAQQQAALEQERMMRYMLVGGLVLLVLLIGLLMVFYRRLQQAKKEVDRLAATALKTNVSLEYALQEQIMLQGELHHRVKNNLQIIISLLEMQGDDIQDDKARERLQIMGERIHSMAAIHEILYTREGVSNASVPEYVNRLCRHFLELSTPGDSPSFQFSLEEVWFDLETLMPVGIILNELLTNTRKYGAKAGVIGIIRVDLTSLNGVFKLVYRDNGPGFPAQQMVSRDGGLGAYLLNSMTRQLGGKLKTYNDNGAVVELTFRAARRSNNGNGRNNGYHSEHEPYHSEHQAQVV